MAAVKPVVWMILLALLLVSLVSSSVPTEAARLVEEIRGRELARIPICPACVCCKPADRKGGCCHCCTGPIGPIEKQNNQP
ncbi:hypothetical protein H6P81_000242 [Aristolochia fimbriata]|uniref:Uncharacterized protein n=1 Tax=Aristolochia fimbriata TaxID=158543 RepID=A0AAV7F4U3_ARIFI|nr:hypothetical protein H6P81_000242 [Aristolochia fimbriata]